MGFVLCICGFLNYQTTCEKQRQTGREIRITKIERRMRFDLSKEDLLLLDLRLLRV